MGIYLPNMEMPKEGEWISVNIFPDGKCFIQSWCGKEFNFAEKLTAVPAADVRPVVRGEWEWEMYQYTPHCSICGGAGFPGPANGKRYNYCPNCGADMREES